MRLYLNQVSFTYDFYSATIPYGGMLVINKISEEPLHKINGYNFVVYPSNSDVGYLCSSVIGSKNEFFEINTEEKEILGKTLDDDNFSKCYIDFFEKGV